MSTTLEAAEAPARDPGTAGGRPRSRQIVRALTGPALIAACVLFALRGFAFTPHLTNDHFDILSFWLPRFTFLARSLDAGHVPLWNPYEMMGYRFAADPQSGWLYVPAMAIFGLLSPGAAMRALIVLNPLVAGLGLYWFLRKESLSRPAATAGGLSLGMLMATSEISISMPFAGFLAWTTIVLVGASGYRQSLLWSRRLAWMALSAFAWWQVANAHMSHGLMMSSLLAGAYVMAHAARSVRLGETSWLRALGASSVFLGFLPLAAAAILIPRLGFIGTSSLQSGYQAVDSLKGSPGIGERSVMTNGMWAAWPLAFGSAPGAYLGGVMLLALPFAWRDVARRATVWALGVSFAITYVMMANRLVTAEWYRALVLRIPFGDVYLHNPGRLRYLSMIALPALGAIGIQALIERPLPIRRAARWLGASVVLFLVVPLVTGGIAVRFALLAVALPAGIVALVLLQRGRRWAPAGIVGVLAVELLASAVFSGVWQGGTIFTGLETGSHPNLVPQVLRWPDVDADEFLRPNALVATIRAQAADAGRYLTWVPPAAFYEKGYLYAQQPRDWPALMMSRGTLFSIPDVLGYNPVQLVRYWTYLRATNDLSLFYNASVVNDPSLEDVRLMGVRYLIVPKGVTPPVFGRAVARAGGYDLMEVYGWEPRASTVPAWTVAGSSAQAFDRILQPGFDPARTSVLEQDPGWLPVAGAVPGDAAYSESDPEHVRVQVVASAPSVVVVRNSFDEGWSATVDGRGAPVLPVDGFLQGVFVQTGRHEVRLTYRDPSIGRGLAVSAAVWSLLLAALLGCLLTERRSMKAGPPP
ncbi:MAG: hypothetical protein H0W82_00575 [Actinobacteria bacterium]|nr:hypothetical protein [Actinomycetota bacterium]